MNVQQNRWLDEALDQITPVNRGEVDAYLRPIRCNAKSRRTFWQWLRIQLEKNGHHQYLKYISELKLPPETVKPHQREGFVYTVNGGVALIDVTSGDDHAVWQVPVAKLDWALSMYPVTLKLLPDLEPEEVTQIRRLKRQLRIRRPFMTPKQKQKLEHDIAGLEALEQRSRAHQPPPRYMILKNADGRTFMVHRLFLDARGNEVVGAVDGDFTNFATTSYTRTEELVPTDGFVVARGDRPPSVWSDQVTVPNLQIKHDATLQDKFEASHLQAKMVLHNGVETNEIYPTPPRVLPNATWLMDAGKHRPLSSGEKVWQGMRPQPPTKADHKRVIQRRKAMLEEPKE